MKLKTFVLLCFLFTREISVKGNESIDNITDLPIDINPEHFSRKEHVPKSSGDLNAIELIIHNSTIFKCHCGANELWDGRRCRRNATFVPVVSQLLSTPIAIDTSEFDVVVQNDSLNCPFGTEKQILNATLGAHFTLLVSNVSHELLDLTSGARFHNYCIEHVEDLVAGRLSWVAYVCAHSPTVPRCCPQGQAWAGAHGGSSVASCVPTTTNELASPPVMLGGQLQNWSTWKGEVAPVLCDRLTENETRFSLDPDRAVLHYLSNGNTSLMWIPPDSTSPEVRTDNFCLAEEEVNGEIKWIASTCSQDLWAVHHESCRGSTCVRKCCPEDTVFNMATFSCLEYDPESIWIPNFTRKNDSVVAPPSNLKLMVGFPLCVNYFALEPHNSPSDKFFLLADGFLHSPNYKKDIPATDYCLDNFLIPENDPSLLPALREMALICFPSDNDVSRKCSTITQEKVYPVLLLVSSLFLLLTLITYVTIPDLHAKIHGKCLVSHVASLLVAYLCLVVTIWSSSDLSMTGCRLTAVLIHFSFLAAFFWLNVMCFDIWWTLKSMRPIAESGSQISFRFKMYALYSWGCPLVIAIAAATVDNLPSDYDLLRPEFGVKKCWFHDNRALWAYFYGFISVLQLANMLFFCHVALILLTAQNNTLLRRSRKQHQGRTWLYLKLFLVMGVTWIAEVISWLEGSCHLWIVTDCMNALQGVFIFVIFICKRNMLRMINTRYEPYIRGIKQSLSRTSHLASSSHEHRNHSAHSQRTSQITLDTMSSMKSLQNKHDKQEKTELKEESALSIQPTTAANEAAVV